MVIYCVGLTGGFYVDKLFVVQCSTVDDVFAVMEEGLLRRHVGKCFVTVFCHSVLQRALNYSSNICKL